MNSPKQILNKYYPVLVTSYIVLALFFTLPTKWLPGVRTTLAPIMESSFRQGWALFINKPDKYELIYITSDGTNILPLKEQTSAGSHFGPNERLALGIYNLCYSWDHYDSSAWEEEVKHFISNYEYLNHEKRQITEIKLFKNELVIKSIQP